MHSSKTVLLTGSTGFIGRNFLEQLGGRYSITAPRRDELDLLDAGRTASFFKDRYFDVVIHAAGVGVSRSQTSATDVYQRNLNMFLNLAHCSNSFGRLIHLGSGAEYGKQHSLSQVKESDFGKVRPEDEYGRAKYEISEYIAAHEHMVNLRCFGVFGKYEDYTTRFISNVLCQSLAGLPIVVMQNTIFDYVDVNDLVSIIAYFIEHEPKEKFYNAGRGQGIELLDVARIIKKVTSNPRDIQIKQPDLGKEYTCDNSLLMKELGDFTFTPLEQSIGELAEWYKANWHTIDQTKLTANV